MFPGNCYRPLLGILLLLAPMLLRAQPPMANLPGQVVDARNLLPVPGATVWLVPGNASLSTSSDSTGRFRIAAIPVGHYALRVAAIGYDTLEVPELWLRAGKQEEQRVELPPTAHALGAVTVSAMAREQPEVLGFRTFTVEQSLRWPATFNDPGRLVTAMAGVAGINDQANHLSIRGNSPNANAYALEGVEIVSPNHTGNAGTPTDLPTLSGGGVNMLSAQMLGPSQLLTGVLPMDRDNAVGGILDMRLRQGNMHERQWTAQAGLLGLDLSTEGPLGKGGRSSYLANYRYSTVGLLSALGVDLGDEAIAFQDLAFNVALPLGKRGGIHVFGMGGNSSNRFAAVHDTLKWKVDKDSRDINYTSQMGSAGASLRIPLGDRTTLTSTLAVSEIDQERTEDQLRTDYTVAAHEAAALSERKLAAMARLDGAVGGRFRWAVGASALERGLTNSLNGNVGGWLLRPWASGRWSLTEHLAATAGIGAAHFTTTNETMAEPRVSLEWIMRRGRKIALSHGLRSQLPQWQSYLIELPAPFAPNRIGLTRSRDIVLGYDQPIAERMHLHTELYHQRLEGIPVARLAASPWSDPQLSLVNLWDEQTGQPLQATGTAINTGLELTVDHHFANNLFYQVNGTLYSSRYTDGLGQEHASRWDGRFMANALAGKEFRKVKENRVRTWGISARANVTGGQYMPPLPVYTNINGNVLRAGDLAWAQLPTFYRVDLRVYLKTDRNGRTGMWALDLQNATNAQNAAFRYFDFRKNEVVTKYQLGLIPNLSYRIEF